MRGVSAYLDARVSPDTVHSDTPATVAAEKATPFAMLDLLDPPAPAVPAARVVRGAAPEEFAHFARDIKQRLHHSAFRLCRDWHLAQDLTQQTFAKMYAGWPRIRVSGRRQDQ